MYILEISKIAQKEIAQYKKSNPKAFAKVAKILGELQVNQGKEQGILSLFRAGITFHIQGISRRKIA